MRMSPQPDRCRTPPRVGGSGVATDAGVAVAATTVSLTVTLDTTVLAWTGCTPIAVNAMTATAKTSFRNIGNLTIATIPSGPDGR